MVKYNAFISYSHAADSDFAPQLQRALEKFAKPWHKTRNLNIFRDESDLSASPQLMDNITKAIDDAEYFIYLASPKAAESHWVQQEISYWINNKPLEKLLVVLTEGDIPWDYKNNSFKDVQNNSVPKVLEEAFTEEPFYIDLREHQEAEKATLKNVSFRKHILKLAAQLHNKAPKDLESEELKQHKKTLRLRNAAISSLVVLFIMATIAAIIAYNKTVDLEDQIIETELERDRANANFIISQAQLERQPTRGLQKAAEALSISNDSTLFNRVYKLYSQNQTYKQLIPSDSLSYPFGVRFMSNSEFVSYHPGTTLAEQVRYVIRNKDGQAVKTFDQAYNDAYANLEITNNSATLNVKYTPESEFVISGSGLAENMVIPYSNLKASLRVAFVSPDNQKLISLWSDGIIRIWDLTTLFIFELQTGHLPSIVQNKGSAQGKYLEYKDYLAISPNGEWLVFVSNDDLQSWNLRNKGIINTYKTTSYIACAGFGSNGKLIFQDKAQQNYTFATNTLKPPSGYSLDCNTEPGVSSSKLPQLFTRNKTVFKLVAGDSVVVASTGEPLKGAWMFPNNQQFITVTQDSVYVYKNQNNIANTNVVIPIKSFAKSNPDHRVANIKVSGDSNFALLELQNNTLLESYLELWDLESKLLMGTYQYKSKLDQVYIDLGFAGADEFFDFTPDSKSFFLAKGNLITVWNRPMTLDELLQDYGLNQ